MQRRLSFLVLALCVLFSTGCGRAVISTEVRADGSFSRMVTLHANKAGGMGPVIKDVFVPPTGAGWTEKDRSSKEGDEAVLELSRAFGSGETVSGDLVLLGGLRANPVPWLRNEAHVRKLGPTRWEYVETLHWMGKTDSIDEAVDPKEQADLVKVVGSQAVVDEIRREILRKAITTMMGPPNPVFAQLVTHPELAEARMRRDMGREIERLLGERFGDRLTREQRTDVARRFLDIVMRKVESTRTKAGHKDKPDGEPSLDPGMVSLTFVVKMPGRLIEANGLRDEVSGTVTWGLFAGAAALGEDLTLRAVFDTTVQP